MKRIVFKLLLACTAIQLVPGNGIAQTAITPATALQRYLHNGDKTYQWEIKETFKIKEATVYTLLLTSQKWREYTWKHELSIIVPQKINHDAALLFITGGSINDKGLPNWSGKDDALRIGFSDVAAKNNAVVAILKQTPNQPLYDTLVEDALISYTLHRFKGDHDYSWPLLFPMVKSATHAMDAVQEFCAQQIHQPVKSFVVSGASKRGWTTWLTGANDPRVVAIAPMVIDMLNMPVSMNYQVKVWNDYSIQIEDYVKLGIAQDISSAKANELTTMIDPYSYRKTLRMPKMIFMGTNDEYWPIDNIKNYYDSIPGQNLLHYIANVGHDMGDKKEALASLGSFFGLTLAKKAYPTCVWKTGSKKGGIEVNITATADKLTDVILWSADSPDKDFRNDKWQSKSLGIKSRHLIKVTEAFPEKGYRAFYLNLKYHDANGGEYTESTRAFMTDEKELL